jgi:hypothetical protein
LIPILSKCDAEGVKPGRVKEDIDRILKKLYEALCTAGVCILGPLAKIT